MADELKFKGVHHVALRVTNTQRSREFYIAVMGFTWLADLGGVVQLRKDNVMLGLIPPDDNRTVAGDRFDEFRPGLDHISFEVKNHEALETALRIFNQHNIPHGPIEDLGDFGYVLPFRDPDNIQLELAAPK
jgi:glyoxylase I family protein